MGGLSKEQIKKNVYKMWNDIHYGGINNEHINSYIPYSDMFLEHPFFHEIIHQSGSKSKDNHFLNNNLKLLCKSVKFMSMLHDDKYRDKYGNTPLQALCSMMHYEYYDEEMKEWIKQNVPYGKFIVDKSNSNYDTMTAYCELKFDAELTNVTVNT